MKRLLIHASFAAAAALSGTAFAQGYVGVGVGTSKVDIDCAGTLTCDDSDIGYKLFGGYMFTPNLGVEAGYYNFGRFDFTAGDAALGDVSGRFKGDGVGLFGVAALPLDRFALFAKLGVASTRVKLDVSSTVDGFAHQSERHSGLAWGVGGGYDFNRNVGVRVEFERFRPEFQREKRDADLLGIGVLYRF